MTRRAGVILLLAVSACRGSEEPQGEATLPTSQATPSLAVLVSVDQMSAELLARYDSLYVGGFRRILDEGYRFVNATHDHGITETAAGHTTLGTGVYPARHGIVANSWSELDGNEWRDGVYAMEDPAAGILGHPELEGRSSFNVNRPGLADWISGRDSAARVVSISKKDRAAIGLAAKARGDVFWMVRFGGGFVTSDFYHEELPAWVERFNETVMPRLYSDTIWMSTVTTSAASLSRPDSSAYELGTELLSFAPPFPEVDQTYFPHRLVFAAADSVWDSWRFEVTPFPDRAVAAFASEAIRELRLGQRASVDYLGISFSQNDLLGHYYGPRSREVLDNLLRLDRELGGVLATLDEVVGPGRWVLALSADHGGMDVPEHYPEDMGASRRTPAQRDTIRRLVEGVLDAFDEPGRQQEEIKGALRALPFVEDAYTVSELEDEFSGVELPAARDSFAVLFARSRSRTRAARPTEAVKAGVYVRFNPLALSDDDTPASHGSSYYYDRHVPLVFLGGGIRPGVSDERVATVDIAPTLAWLTATPIPDDLDGRVLRSVRDRR